LQLSAQLLKEANIKEREIAISDREGQAEDLMKKLEEKDFSLKKREAVLLGVEQSIADCQTSIEDRIEHEIKENLKVSA
jgi:hypothetical protein